LRLLANENNVVDVRDSLILVDFDLKENYMPELIFYGSNDKKESRLQLDTGTNLDWYVQPEHFCIGYHTKDEYHSYIPCPQSRKLEKGFQCDRCKNRDLLIPCMLCKGDECINIDSVKEICDKTPTSVYLVTFGDDIKVGVSKKNRLMKRWIEQGAELVTEVGLFPNGLIAREVEETISYHFLIPKGIRIKTKFSSVKTENQNIMDEDQFRIIIDKISTWLGDKYGNEFIGSCEINDLNSNYHVVNSEKIDTKGNVALKGKFVGNKGPIFIINKFGQNFCFDVRSLRGRKIGNKPSLGSQGLLSDYFS